ncbi:polysaccharide lyase family 8 super-sandwich domain-containing protein [Labilibacter marinus]|uniref:polysaccharide lyase family 8 super-sandwich domain-containing protein n=1 Tax=Labilibacter marinus TaxID=1477105 RepID=UPI00082B8C2F|nr:polysaccharide lyase family 8 super-sandwich domain-containing protein [Labilibacter marinus]
MRNITIILLVAILFSCDSKAPQSQLSILEQNWKNYLLNEEVNPEILPYFFNLQADGTWSDLDYNNRQKGNWPLHAHLWRTIEMAKAYQQKGHEYYKNKQLSENIHTAYNWWVNKDIVNSNWWYPQIGIPQSIGVIMLLMQDEIKAEQWQKGMTIMNRVEFGNKTGQNLVWVSSNIVLRSILKNDTSLLSEATEKIRKEMQLADNDVGLQADYSFHQHGRQLQMGNYGLHFLEDQVKWMFILKGSEYDYTQEQIVLMRNYFEHGQRWVIWKDVYDINSSGRQLFPNEQVKKYKRVFKAAVEMKGIDPDFADLYQSISKENDLTGVKHFPFSELTVQRTKQSFTSIRMCSSRIKGSESGNGENLSGYYLADGAMYLMQTGQEYLNIYPYWDWRKIPGTTSVQDTAKLPEIGWGSYNIPSDFVGGLTFDNCALTSMQYKRDGVSANKSYFLFPDFTVCLGSGITGQNNQHIQTTIEQCFSTTPLYINDGKSLMSGLSGAHIKGNVRSFWHQGVGYIINQGDGIVADLDKKSANWSNVLNWYNKEEEPQNIFTLGIDHGKNVKNDKYAYAVFPNMDKEDLANTYQQQPYQILANTEEIQAVQFDDYTSIVFHQPGSIKINDSTELSSNVPAIVLCKKDQNQLSMAICDPTQKLASGQITVSKKGQTSTHEITFPVGSEKGKAVILSEN